MASNIIFFILMIMMRYMTGGPACVPQSVEAAYSRMFSPNFFRQHPDRFEHLRNRYCSLGARPMMALVAQHTALRAYSEGLTKVSLEDSLCDVLMVVGTECEDCPSVQILLLQRALNAELVTVETEGRIFWHRDESGTGLQCSVSPLMVSSNASVAMFQLCAHVLLTDARRSILTFLRRNDEVSITHRTMQLF